MIAYKLTNTVNGKVYIGITVHSIPKRMSDHRYASKHSDTALYRAVRKYGWNAFVVEVVSEAKDHAELKELERLLIAEHKSADARFGYNSTEGGDGSVGRRPSSETREKLRQAAVSQMKDPAARARLYDCARAQWADPEKRQRCQSNMLGRTMSAEHKAKMDAAMKAKGPEYEAAKRTKIAATLRGRTRPEEVKRKISEAMSGRRMPEEFGKTMSEIQKGKPKSEAHKAAMRAAWVRRKERAITS